jgi:hypothetical protein
MRSQQKTVSLMHPDLFCTMLLEIYLESNILVTNGKQHIPTTDKTCKANSTVPEKKRKMKTEYVHSVTVYHKYDSNHKPTHMQTSIIS